MLPGFVLNQIISRLRSMTIFLSLCAMVVGLLLVGTVPDVPLMLLGILFAGVGYGILQPIIYDKTAIIAPPDKATKALSVVMTANYVAVVVCPFVVDFIEKMFHLHDKSFPFVAGAVVLAVVAAMALVWRGSFVFGLDESYYEQQKTEN